MGKKRRRSEASDTDGDSGSSLPVQKKQRIDNWNFPVELNRKVGEASYSLGRLVGIN